ncbi:MAG: Nramp family divalent metal transporter [Chloroflexi bacterium]|nr:Nramp family divalent metal transporter [Chloroflexota bacterium]
MPRTRPGRHPWAVARRDAPALCRASAPPVRPARVSPSRVLRALGPGVVAGASDNDPTSVATLVVIGSTVGYGLNWLIVLVLPMLVAVQIISARVGLLTRCSLEQAIRGRFGKPWALVAMLFVLAVNVITIAADLEGGAAALGLLVGLEWRWFVLPFALVVAALLLFGSYDEVQHVLRYVLVIFVAYVAAALLARPDWGEVARSTLVPRFEWSPDYVRGALALLGTTLTSYVYFWETIEEREERRPPQDLPLVEVDAAVGMVVTVAVFWFIAVSTAATLGAAHQPVTTADEAARALAPVAGPYAGLIFAVGLLASAVLAVPVLAGTTAYVLADAFGWKSGLSEPVQPATLPFYGVVVGSLALGAALTYAGVAPIALLFFAGIVGGLGTPLLLVLLLLLGQDRAVMGEQRVPGWLAAIGWFTCVLVSLAGLLYLAQQVLVGG